MLNWIRNWVGDVGGTVSGSDINEEIRIGTNVHRDTEMISITRDDQTET